jgi:hypothetical protein
MKSLIILTASFLLLCSLDYQSSVNEVRFSKENNKLYTEYQRGWADGHCEGWKDVKGKYAYCPYPPYPPYAPYPTYPKSHNSYKDGYNDGFKRGMSDALKN